MSRPRRISANEKIGIAGIGAGGQGEWDILGASRGNDVVAICDVDLGMGYKTIQRFPGAKRYQDFRRMLDEMKHQIDAVTVSIPDHQHAVATMMALQMGKHVYTQKPMAHDIWEVRKLADVARQSGLATQMGIQGTANDWFREAVEVVQSGAIGQIREVHVWSNRPFWPQGIRRSGRAVETPSTLAWDLWLGTAPQRPYDRAYHPVKWRGWCDFGTGTLGDMGCHSLNLPFLALRLEAPTSVEAELSDDANDDTYPTWTIVRYEFPARAGLPPVRLTWYDGGTRMDPATREVIAKLLPIKEVPASGILLLGSTGSLLSPDEYGGTYKLFPEDRFRDYRPPAPVLPRCHGEHHGEWIASCRKEGGTMASFDYAARLTETVLLGCVAIQSRSRIEWDSTAMKVTNEPKANNLLRRDYRSGWSL